MRLDATQFPLVWIRTAGSSKNPEDSPFSEFEALLARKEIFVLLNDESLDAAEHEHPREEMKRMSLWMKRHKSDLRAFVKASIHIESSVAKRLAAKAFAVIYEEFWGYPMLMTPTKEEALALAHKLLVGEPLRAQAD